MTSIDAARWEREEWEYEEEDRRLAMSRARTVDEYREAAAGILGPGDLPAVKPASVSGPETGDAGGTMDVQDHSEPEERVCPR
jgi:hypothetical protein